MANLPSGLSALFNLRPDRAADYLAAKGLRLTGPYWELDGPGHSRNFTVANLAKVDVLADIKAAVQQALDEGQTERWFRGQLVDTLRAKGWWGPAVQVDPDTQEARIIQQGSHRRLQTIYRTNLQSAYMAGRHRQAVEQSDRAPWAQYLAVLDSRTRPAHRDLHGKVFRIDSPEWGIVSPPRGYNCFPGDTPVRAAATLGLKTWYAGPMVQFETRLGHRLAVTANHPVLTRRGWFPAHALQKGDQLIGALGVANASLVGIVDDKQPPVRADDLFESLALEGLRITPMAAHDFHGDAFRREGEIQIAGADSGLMDERQSAADQLVGKRQFGRGNGRLGMGGNISRRPAFADPVGHEAGLLQDSPDIGGLGAGLSGNRALGGCAGPVKGDDAPLQMLVGAVSSGPSGRQLSLDGGSVFADLPPLERLGFGAVAQRDPLATKQSVEHVAGDSGLFRQLIEANASLVVVDDVVEVRQFDWCGHVYDFQTETGLIVAGGVVVHNCRCRARYLSDRELAARGLKPVDDARIVERTPPGKPPADPLTGETPARWIQRGVSIPDPNSPSGRAYSWTDPGWDHLPGSDGAERSLVDRLMATAKDLGQGVLEAVVQQRALGAVVARRAQKAPAPKRTVADVPREGAADPPRHPMFSTAPGVTEPVLRAKLNAISEERAALLDQFMARRQMKSLWLSTAETRPRTAQNAAIHDAVEAFLAPGPGTTGYTSRRARSLGYTGQAWRHVVVRTKKATKLAKADIAKAKATVEEAAQKILKAEAEFPDAGTPIERASNAFRRGKARSWTLSWATHGDEATERLGVWLHEMGHQVHYAAGSPRQQGFASLTQYGATNSAEWHAEHWAAWFLDRDALAGWDPRAATYFDDLMAKAIKENL